MEYLYEVTEEEWQKAKKKWKKHPEEEKVKQRGPSLVERLVSEEFLGDVAMLREADENGDLFALKLAMKWTWKWLDDDDDDPIGMLEAMGEEIGEEQLKELVDRVKGLRKEGNDLFKAEEYAEAMGKFTS